jgi:hypothetical protein
MGKTMKNKKKQMLMLSLGGVATGAMLLLLTPLNQGLTKITPTQGEEGSYQFSFGSNTNKIGSEAYTPSVGHSGTGSITTSVGTAIPFAYHLFENPTTAWQTIEAGGYFYNTAAIHGLKSISLTKDSVGSIEIYWSRYANFETFDYETFSAGTTAVTCTFKDIHPNFVKVKALTNTTITSGSIAYSCVARTVVGKSFYCGRYPQTLVEDATLKTALATAQDSNGDGYLEYGGNDYKKAVGAPKYSDTYPSRSGKTIFQKGTTYYFKVEPILWRVLIGTNNVNGMGISEYLLDKTRYCSCRSVRTIDGTVYSQAQYRYSTLRAMLNGLDFSSYEDAGGYNAGDFKGKGVVDIAFNAAERAVIHRTSPVAGTNDLLYVIDKTNANDYGYLQAINSNPSLSRVASPSDYARAIGVPVVTAQTATAPVGAAPWWLATYANSSKACEINEDGKVLETTPATYPDRGIRPSMMVDYGEY